MSRTNILRNSRDDKAVKFLEFIRLHSKDREQLCCFFEGDDAKYYSVRISTTISTRWSAINCKGKAVVLDLYALISKHPVYSAARTAFFIDRDFDPPIPSSERSRVYETPCYSVENLYTSTNCFKTILQSEFGVTDGIHDGTVLDKCTQMYVTTKRLFHSAILELNAWIYLQRTRYRGAGKLNLRGIRVDRFVAVGLGAVTKLYTVSELEEIFPEAAKVDEVELQEAISEFQQRDCCDDFRGKYEIEFLRLVLIKLIDDCRSEHPVYFPKRGTVKCNLSRENLISELSQYADSPSCLREYLVALN